MDICSIASGSSGNCIYLATTSCKILIDVGYSGRKIEILLNEAGIEAQSLDAIFVTHEHSDHIAGVGVLSRRFDLPIFANKKTWSGMEKKLGRIKPSNKMVFENEKEFYYKDMAIYPMSIYHDALDPVAFIFKSGNEKTSILTDTGLVDERMSQLIRGSDIYYLEANHDIKMLKAGPYPPDLKRRILSRFGHLSNFQAAQLLGQILEGRGEQIILGHLSEKNNRPELAKKDIANYLAERGYVEGENIFINVAAAFSPTPIISASGKLRRESNNELLIS